ncbi:MAG: TauD/TfdA family dioxygenase, partial [Rhodospirillaceae bacterium]|nr:TauD/TfdA family dioxygenase [Rhodospirillaceae bacterium]
AALAAIQATGKPVQDIHAADFPLPTLGKKLNTLADALESGRGFGVVRGVPVGKYSEDALKIVSWGLCCQFGTGIPQSRQGDWINHVIDVSDVTETAKPDLQHIIKRGQLRTNHAGGELDFHTDTTDIFALFCLRNAKSGGTSRLASVATLHNMILDEKPDYAKALYDGYFYMSQSVDNEGGAPRVSANRVPVFTRKGKTVQGYYISQVVQRAMDQGGVTYNPVEDDAREEIQRAANAPGVAHEFLLEPGDLLVANNRAVLHARYDYEDHAELDRRRHMFRLWMATTPEMLTKTFSAPSDRFS